ncbi:MAG TPA: nuclear transport factor 2 family protein [Candidatus Xenobia bacterium]|jgi:hypothetical protein
MTLVEQTRNVYDAFSRGEVQTILDNVAENVEWGHDSVATEIPWHGLRHGRAGVAQFLQVLSENVEFQHFEPYMILGEGNEVVAFIRMKTKLRKNGIQVNQEIVHHSTYNDQRKVVRFRAYNDTAHSLMAWRGEKVPASV